MATRPRPRLSGLSLFSGAGGLDLGAFRAGVDVALAIDKLPEAKISYERLLPDAEFHLGDVRSLASVPVADVVLGGYPCQPFSMGGPRRPDRDARSGLYLEFARILGAASPRYFVAENVAGLHALNGRRLLDSHLSAFASAGEGYNITVAVLRSEDFGVPQRRRRLLMVGVRRDLGTYYHFPEPDHTASGAGGTKRFVAHGDVIGDLPAWPAGEFYERPDEDGHWPWYYMSRNRRAHWEAPSYTILANARHTPIHPGSPRMRKAWSHLSDGFKQGWEFTDEHDHIDGHPDRLALDRPRRLSWRECALIQSFPSSFEPAGNLMRKVELIGNAVPPLLAEVVVRGLVDGSALQPVPTTGPAETWGPEGPVGDAVVAGRRQRDSRTSNTGRALAELRTALHTLGLRYRLSYKALALSGKWRPIDIAFPGARLAVFVDGCFWHGCPDHGAQRSSTGDYWRSRLERNADRDATIDAELARLGWTVVRVWEHEDARRAAKRIERRLSQLRR